MFLQGSRRNEGAHFSYRNTRMDLVIGAHLAVGECGFAGRWWWRERFATVTIGAPRGQRRAELVESKVRMAGPGDGGGAGRATEPITAWLRAAQGGDRDAAERLYRAVYDELRRIARVQQARVGWGATATTTALVQDLYLRLAKAGDLVVDDRNHFFSLAARMLRQILIDGARRRLAGRRGAGARAEPLDLAELVVPDRPDELVALDEALDQLERRDGELARLVEQHFFAGLTFAEIAEVTGRSERTLRRDWRRARAFLYDQLRDLGGAPAVAIGPPAEPR
jgi:RNA polymerase sigma factor (TIGR02999 family)